MNRWRVIGKVTIVLMPIVAVTILLATGNPFVVRINDECDPTTFNAAFGPDTCSGNGQITLQNFLAQLTAAKKAGAWHFTPGAGALAPGTVISLQNRGGEFHTFTKVENFGGGFIQPLNILSGNPVPARECAMATQDGLFPQPDSPTNIYIEAGETEDGPTAGSSILPSGTKTKFQCCVHPWMRTELTTK